MSKTTWAICAAVIMTTPIAVPAQQPSTGAFDGTYRGVSRQVESGPMGRGNMARCVPDGQPAPLRIVNGIARAGSAETPMEGAVTPNGALVMRTQAGGKLEGQIDGGGRAAGRFIASCTYQLVWQRDPR